MIKSLKSVGPIIISGPPDNPVIGAAAFRPDTGTGGTPGMVPAPPQGARAAGLLLGAAGWQNALDTISAIAPIAVSNIESGSTIKLDTGAGLTLDGSDNLEVNIGAGLAFDTSTPKKLIATPYVPQQYAFGSLPTPVTGMTVIITDAAVNTWGTAITVGAGPYTVLAWYNGTNWTVLGI